MLTSYAWRILLNNSEACESLLTSGWYCNHNKIIVVNCLLRDKLETYYLKQTAKFKDNFFLKDIFYEQKWRIQKLNMKIQNVY
jgi:hypothetical protein